MRTQPLNSNKIQCHIGLGSNLQQPLNQLKHACDAIALVPLTTIVGRSPWYESKAVGPGEQPNYLNGVVTILTELKATELLNALQNIENAQGRKREIRWGARTLDLDILLYGAETIQTERLTIPHPYLEERNFVIYPLADIEPSLVLPSGKPISVLKKELSREGLTIL